MNPIPRRRPIEFPEQVYMLVDPATREAYRPAHEGGGLPGPAFFTTEERARAYAAEHGLHNYEVYSVPGGILARVRGRPHWINGKRQG
ncbi:MAG: hypothetical protein HY320_01885 [Armatimonadetes bacterium]|nr:hypothetical protein [Armatimonadota bacterium]